MHTQLLRIPILLTAVVFILIGVLSLHSQQLKDATTDKNIIATTSFAGMFVTVAVALVLMSEYIASAMF